MFELNQKYQKDKLMEEEQAMNNTTLNSSRKITAEEHI